MKNRLIIYLLLTMIAAGIFMFAPAFNIGGKPMVSMYAQYIGEGRIAELLIRVGFLSIGTFIGLAFLFGFKSTKK